MRKIFTFLFAALMSVSMWAEPITVTWNNSDMPSYGSSYTKDGVTLTCTISDSDMYGPGTFTTDLGNFTQIVVSAPAACYIEATGGWSGNTDQKTWTGNASSVSFSGNIYGFSTDVTFVFTIEPAAPAVKYYIVGNMTNWEVNENYEMNPSLEAETEEYFYGLDLTTASQFKVVKVEGENKTWYPDGMGNAYGEHGEIERGGEYTIYFRPNMDGGEAWYNNCILAVRHAVAERVLMGFLLPENGMPQAGIKLIGSFEDEMLDLNLNGETGWYVHYNVMAADEDKFYIRDAADEENYLHAFADGKWDIAEFVFDEVWEDDTWKGEPIKWIELDLSDNTKYAWANAIPDGIDNVAVDAKAVKIIRNGEVLILKNGKTFNLLGAEVR